MWQHVAAKDLVYVRRLLEELQIFSFKPSILYEDNRACIEMSSKHGLHKRSKHINVRYHWLREMVLLGEIQLRHIPGTDMPADILTKPLPQASFERHRATILNIANNQSENHNSEENQVGSSHSNQTEVNPTCEIADQSLNMLPTSRD